MSLITTLGLQDTEEAIILGTEQKKDQSVINTITMDTPPITMDTPLITIYIPSITMHTHTILSIQCVCVLRLCMVLVHVW